MHNIDPVFCTYFKKIEHFLYSYETYDEYVAFCVKQGSFFYQIGDKRKEIACDGEIVICPPNHRFYREVIEPVELCMIKFHVVETEKMRCEKIKVSNPLRWSEDMKKLKECLFCDKLKEDALYHHYCMDILYIALESNEETGKIFSVKTYLDKNYNKKLFISELAKQTGYTTPHLITKFKLCYGTTPKMYLLQLRLQKAKEFLLTTDMLSREVAYEVGFTDELYFIRFFKKYTGVTPQQFRERGL